MVKGDFISSFISSNRDLWLLVGLVPNLRPESSCVKNQIASFEKSFEASFFLRSTLVSLQKTMENMRKTQISKIQNSQIKLSNSAPKKNTCLLTSDTSRASFCRTSTGMTRSCGSATRIHTGDFRHAGHLQFPLRKP